MKFFNFNNSDFNIFPSFNISPGQDVNVIISYKHENYFLKSNWGYNFFNTNTQNKQVVINSRIETIKTKLLFKDSFLKRKCVIPANGYFEWSKKHGEKKPYFIKLGEGELIYFAGVWRKEKYNNDKRRVFSIITKAANSNVNKIHHRMPLVLNANAAQDYLELKDDNLNLNNLKARIRYRQALQEVSIKADKDFFYFDFTKNQKAIARGQFISIYKSDELIASGVID